MKTVLEHIRERMYERMRMPADKKEITVHADLRKTEWCSEFEEHMRDRLVMGAFRYGKIGAPGKPEWDRVGDIPERLKKYVETGNTEFLVDIANMALLEFVEGRHPNKHFRAIDDGAHTDVR